jgi:hypothetical protein
MIKRWQDWANYFLGLWVFGSTRLLEHSMVLGVPGGGSRAMWNLWVVGLPRRDAGRVVQYVCRGGTLVDASAPPAS